MNERFPDYSTLLEDFIPSIENIPSELAYLLDELGQKDAQFQSLRESIHTLDLSLRKLIKSGPTNPPETPTELSTIEEEPLLSCKSVAYADVSGFPDQLAVYNKIQDEYVQANVILAEKLAVADKMRDLIERQSKRLLLEMERVQVGLLPPQSTAPVFIDRNSDSSDPHKRRLSRPAPNARGRRKAPSGPPLGFLNGLPRSSSITPDVDEQLYCFCQQVSYGEMIACDNDDCPHEWFHLGCIGLSEPPKTGVWYCPDCTKSLKKRDF